MITAVFSAKYSDKHQYCCKCGRYHLNENMSPKRNGDNQYCKSCSSILTKKITASVTKKNPVRAFELAMKAKGMPSWMCNL